MSDWCNENGDLCWIKKTDKINTRNKAKLEALSCMMNNSYYLDLRVRTRYGKIVPSESWGEELMLCDKSDDEAFAVWEIQEKMKEVNDV